MKIYEIIYRKRRYTKSETKRMYLEAINSIKAREKAYKYIGLDYIVIEANKIK